MYGGGGNDAALFDGGGFMPSQATQTPESSVSKNRTAQKLLPLTVKQIVDARQSNDDKSSFVVDNVEVHTVRLLGRVLNKVERVTDVSFTLDDGTGRIEVNRWESDPSATGEMLAIKNGDYVVANGSLRGFQGKQHLLAYSVRPVTNFNDITHHFLHCIHVHLENTRHKPQGNVTTATITTVTPIKNEVMGNHGAFSNNQASFRTDTTGNRAPSILRQEPTYSAYGNTLGTEKSNLVLAVFNDPTLLDNEHGVSVDYVMNRLRLPADELRRIIQDHVEVGNIYSTIDDNHYKSACNG